MYPQATTADVSPKTTLIVSALDGIPRDSIAINLESHGASNAGSFPGSNWIVMQVDEPAARKLVIVDRSGKIASSSEVPLKFNLHSTASDALWGTITDNGLTAIVRVPFDAPSGRIGQYGDTVYTGNPTGMSVTADGSSVVFDEGTTQWSAWALNTSDIASGSFPDNRRIFAGTSGVRIGISPDGNKILLLRPKGAGAAGAGLLTVLPFGGGAEREVSSSVNWKAIPTAAGFFADDSSIAIIAKSKGGLRFSLVDPATYIERARYEVADSSITDFAALPKGGWAWVSADRRSLSVGYPGRPVRKLPRPSWLTAFISVSASPDGTHLAYDGWLAPTEDSLVVGTIDVNTGSANRLADLFVENGFTRWNHDNSLTVAGWETQESATINRLTLDGKLTKTASVARPAAWVTVSQDFKRAVVLLREYHGDAWMAKVVRQ